MERVHPPLHRIQALCRSSDAILRIAGKCELSRYSFSDSNGLRKEVNDENTYKVLDDAFRNLGNIKVLPRFNGDIQSALEMIANFSGSPDFSLREECMEAG